MNLLQTLILFLFISSITSPPVQSDSNPKTVEDYSRKPSESFIQQWEAMMADFTPEDILTFMVQGFESDVVNKT